MPEFSHHRSIAGDPATPPPVEAVPAEPWVCRACRRYLATVKGDRFERPDGTAGHLPAVIRCPRCRRRNVRG